jgi:hypothetical protein
MPSCRKCSCGRLGTGVHGASGRPHFRETKPAQQPARKRLSARRSIAVHTLSQVTVVTSIANTGRAHTWCARAPNKCCRQLAIHIACELPISGWGGIKDLLRSSVAGDFDALYNSSSRGFQGKTDHFSSLNRHSIVISSSRVAARPLRLPISFSSS